MRFEKPLVASEVNKVQTYGITVKVDELMRRLQRRRSIRSIALEAEGDIGQVEPEEG